MSQLLQELQSANGELPESFGQPSRDILQGELAEENPAGSNKSAEASDCPVCPGPGQFPGFWKPFRSVFWAVHVAFGTVCLILILAILAAIPVLNLLALGYLLDAQRRIAESGRLRDGFPLLKLAPRLGVICFFVLLFLIPIRLLAVQVSAALIVRDGAEISSEGLLLSLKILKIAVAVHLLLAIARGGSLGCFLRPFKNVLWLFQQIRSGAWLNRVDRWGAEALQTLQPWRHFRLGLNAVVGASCWLLIPTGLLVAFSAPGRVSGGFGLLSFLGGVLMIPVAAWLPMLQVHQAATGRFRSIFEIRAARKVIQNAPFAWMVTTVLLYVLTLPLYLTKIRLLPEDAFLVLTPIFILLTYPARVMLAWAFHRGTRSQQPAWFGFRWSARILMVPLLAVYAMFLFITPTISELGKAAPLENHAFLSPIPYAQWGGSSD